MNGFEHVAHLADPGGRHMAEDVPIKMNHAALPLSVGQILRGTLDQASAGVGDDELHAVEAAVVRRASNSMDVVRRTHPAWSRSPPADHSLPPALRQLPGSGK